ncbi:MAG: AbrB/MazE/SpoVT family DNA-binding domain-containing protein [Luteolibacter sp.]
MTTVLSQKGQIVLPSSIREQMQLEAGQDFEVFIDDEDTITLRKINRPPNHGLVDHLLACPYPFKIPPRAKDTTTPISL